MMLPFFPDKDRLISKARKKGFELGKKQKDFEKNKEINLIKLDHRKALKEKIQMLKKYRKRVNRIEKGTGELKEVILRLCFISQKLVEDKFLKMLKASNEYKECLAIESELLAIRRKFEKVMDYSDKEIEEFRLIS